MTVARDGGRTSAAAADAGGGREPTAASTRRRELTVKLRRRLTLATGGAYLFNPWRRRYPRLAAPLRWVLTPAIRLGLMCGFPNVDYAAINGPPDRLHVGAGCSTMNTVFNTVSGTITVGPDTIFSHDCHILTGTHRFWAGRRASLSEDAPIDETPTTGRDVVIGAGCFFGAGAVVIGPVTLGDDVIVGAGAVVTKDVPHGSFVAGVPARVIAPS